MNYLLVFIIFNDYIYVLQKVKTVNMTGGGPVR